MFFTFVHLNTLTMKKIIITLSVALFIISCGSKAKSAAEINVNELNTACECVDAMEVVFDETLALIEGKTEDEIEADAELEKKVNALGEKYDEIEGHCLKAKQMKRADAEACPNFKQAKEKKDKIEEIL
jgi:hypothetical protein